MRQRESWRKVRRDNAIRAEKKKVKSFSSAIKSGLIDFQCRWGIVMSHYSVMQKTMLRKKKKDNNKKKERIIALVRAVDTCLR